ncbi:TetR/AcrR family transcriptional regulator [Tsukamurella tyrosinosolvens]|uniref:TetR/AcrR family transcriptional regulator n=1 Tax=Tsukamurella tyrosinosolvens TaxID=57704 RepID=UPI000799C3ED|nr:TetR/AcrR family transcriptional regulator [Tsukamurella tyrosinosolvens]KXP04870.1 TetR family transcriptional regulator [Tsukamurella tyrosinosolvens]
MTETFGVDAAAHEAARTTILDVAAEVFQQQGFSRATIDDIAEGIGATKGRVYYYFRSKFDIYLAVYEHGMRLVRDAVEPLAEGPGTGRDRLIAMCEAHAENLMSNLSYHNAIHQGIHRRTTPALKARQAQQLAELNRIRHDYETMFRRVVIDGVSDGTLRDEDPQLTARMLLSSLNSIDSWFSTRPGQSAEELRDLAARITSMLISGLESQ